jgi:hypothetical protein
VLTYCLISIPASTTQKLVFDTTCPHRNFENPSKNASANMADELKAAGNKAIAEKNFDEAMYVLTYHLLR